MQLQFVTHNAAPLGTIEQIRAVLLGGVRWIQLRIKNIGSAELLPLAQEAKVVCDSFKATLIVNDYVEVAKQVGASGVHLGKHDCRVGMAREILGPDSIIGGTANCAGDIQQHILDGANYIGLGPLHYTSTKEDLSPVLGLDGIQQLGKLYGGRIPIIAIGGVTKDDIFAISLMDIAGVAVSGAIALSNDVTAAARKFVDRTDSMRSEIAIRI